MAFEEIKAKLGLDITEFEKGMLDANRAAKQAAAAQAKLSDFRRAKSFEEADARGKILIVEQEIAQLYAVQSKAAAGTAPHLQAQLEIEKKLAQIGTIRANQKRAELAASKQTAAASTTKAAAAPADGGFVALRKSVIQTAGAFGASDLLKGFGIGALVMAMKGAVASAQELRKEARELGKDLDPAVAASARLGDAFSNIGKVGFNALNSISKVIMESVDGMVALTSALFGVGTVNENLNALSSDQEGAAMRAKKFAEERAKAEQEATKKQQEFSKALADLEQARVESLYEQLGIEDQILFKKEQLVMALQDAQATQADTVEAIKAEQDILQIQSDIRNLMQKQEAEAADKKQQALELQQKTEQSISAEKEKQLEKEQKLAAIRDASAKKLATAQEAAARAGEAYAQALSDQSAATLSEVTAGTRGSRSDQRAALRVQELRTQAQRARDLGQVSLIGGEAVSRADLLSQQANQIQSGIGSLSSTERDPLASVTEQLVKANEELASIRESLTIMEVQY